MRRELNGTDVKMLAKGYWEHYFNWRLHPKVKAPFFTAAATLGVIVVLLAASIGPDPMPQGIRTLGMLLFVAFAISALWTVFVSLRERDHFLDAAQDIWEAEEELPDREMVAYFLQSGFLTQRKSK